MISLRSSTAPFITILVISPVWDIDTHECYNGPQIRKVRGGKSENLSPHQLANQYLNNEEEKYDKYWKTQSGIKWEVKGPQICPPCDLRCRSYKFSPLITQRSEQWGGDPEVLSGWISISAKLLSFRAAFFRFIMQRLSQIHEVIASGHFSYYLSLYFMNVNT